MPKGLDILLTTEKAIILALFSQFRGVGNFRNVHGKKKKKNRNLKAVEWWRNMLYIIEDSMLPMF